MANLVNCALCGSRERPSDLSLYGGKMICEDCEENTFELFDDPRSAVRYIEDAPIAAPKDLWGKPLEREVVVVGWDGRSNPIRRYADELHLADHLRTIPPS